MAAEVFRQNLHFLGLAHLCLFVANALLLLIPSNTDPIIVYTATLVVYIGSWRSVKTGPPEEAMTKKDALQFPVFGSISLASLFVLLKLFPADVLNTILVPYFSFMGLVATVTTLTPFLEHYYPHCTDEKIIGPYKLRIPQSIIAYVPIKKIRELIIETVESIEIAQSWPELAVGVTCFAACCVYVWTKHWFFNNLMGLAFAIEGIEYLTITSTKTGILMLAGLFFYDIYWVFFTPVMVAVATALDIPIKLVYPQPISFLDKGKQPYAMLGLGDIVIPGVFISSALRYDIAHHNGRPVLFISSCLMRAMTGYCTGLIWTLIVVNVFKSAQPALLYIVPSVFLFVLSHAAFNGELKKFFNYCAMKEYEEHKAKEQARIGNRKER